MSFFAKQHNRLLCLFATFGKRHKNFAICFFCKDNIVMEDCATDYARQNMCHIAAEIFKWHFAPLHFNCSTSPITKLVKTIQNNWLLSFCSKRVRKPCICEWVWAYKIHIKLITTGYCHFVQTARKKNLHMWMRAFWAYSDWYIFCKDKIVMEECATD